MVLNKVGKSLYRKPTRGAYYARVEMRGKQFKSSLKMVNLAEARRKQKDFRAMFKRGVDDRILARSPVDGVEEEKTEKPIRRTSSLAEFQALADSSRKQKMLQ